MRGTNFFWLAAALCLFAACAHAFVGAPMVLPPLHDSELPSNVVWLHVFSWHAGTVLALGMGALFVYAARSVALLPCALVAVGMNVSLGTIGVSLALLGDPALWGSPAPYLWWVTAAAGTIGIVRRRRGEAPALET